VFPGSVPRASGSSPAYDRACGRNGNALNPGTAIADRLQRLYALQWAPWAIVLGLALLLRLPGLVDRPLWYDEAFAVLFSAKGLPSMVEGTLRAQAGVAADVHPLLYYTLLGIWGKVFGTSVAAVRSLSLGLGLGVVALGYALGRRSLGRRAGLVGGILLAVSPFQIHYAQEVRMYGLLAGLLLGATWAHWEARSGAGVGAWAAFAVLSAAAQYTHNLAAFYLIALALLPWLERRWRLAVQTLAAGLVAAALYLPWLLYLPSQVARLRWAYWIERPTAADLVRTLITFLADRPLPNWPTWAIPLVLFCALLVWATLAWTLTRLPGESASRGEARRFALLAVAPIALLFAASFLQPLYLDRALLPSAAAFSLALGWLLTEARSPRAARGMMGVSLLVASAVGLVGFFSYRGFPHAPFEVLNDRLRAGMIPGEVIVHSNKISALPAEYYGPELEHRYLADPAGSPSDTLAIPTQQVLGMVADRDIESAAAGAAGVWFVQFRQEQEDYADLGFSAPPALTWLEENLVLESRTELGDLLLYHFLTPGEPAPNG